MFFLNFGLWFLCAYFVYGLIKGLVKVGGWFNSKKDEEVLAGCLGVIIVPVFYGLSIATMIGAIFAVN